MSAPSRAVRAVSWAVVGLYGVGVAGLLLGADARDVALLLGLAVGLDSTRAALRKDPP